MQESDTKDCHYRYSTEPLFAHLEGGPWGNASAVQEWLKALIARQDEGRSLGLGQHLADSGGAGSVEDTHAVHMEWQPPSSTTLLSMIRKNSFCQLYGLHPCCMIACNVCLCCGICFLVCQVADDA